MLAPLRVAAGTWPTEAGKWNNLRNVEVSAVVGTQQQRKAALLKPANVFTTNYENVPWLVEHLGDKWPFRKVVSDESTKLKSFRLRQGSKRAQALAKVAHCKVDRFIELTGTPSPNGLLDLWGQMWFLDKGERLGRNFNAYTSRWFNSVQVGADRHAVQYTPRPGAQAEIQALLKDICLSLEAKDYFDIQAPIVNRIYVELPAKAKQLYRDMERRMFMTMGEHEVEAANAASKTMKCLQVANGAIYTDEARTHFEELHDVKLQALESILEEAGGAPVLTAYHFKHDLERIKRAFPHAIDVATDEGLRRAQNGEGTLWVGHPASMGHGIDGLQNHCNIGAFYGHWWDLEQRQQFIERIGPTRQAQAGRDVAVTIHDIVAVGTVDEEVIARHESKKSVQDILMDSMKRKKYA